MDVRELHDDGSWNRLDAEDAVYGYASRTVSAGGVTVFLGEGAAVRRDDRPRAAGGVGPRREDDRASRGVPGGTRRDGWTGELSRGNAGPGGIGPAGPRTGEDRRSGRLRPGEEPRLEMGGGEDHDGVDPEPPLAGEGSRSEGVRPMRIRTDLRGPVARRGPGRRRRGAGARGRIRAGAGQPPDRRHRRPHQRRQRAQHRDLRGERGGAAGATSRSTPTGSEADYSREAGAIDRIEAEGNVRFVQEGREARSPRATFHNLEQRIVLSGGATLRQGENTVQGETLTIFLRENRSVVTGGKDGGRVRAVINPKGIVETSPK